MGDITLKLLLIQAGAVAAFDNEGNVYVNTNEDRKLWLRYRKYCDELILLMRVDSKLYSKSEAITKFYSFDKDLARLVCIPNVYNPRINFFNLRMRAKARKIIAEEICNADRVIVRSAGFWPSTVALKICRKYRKTYLVEAVDVPFDMRWHSGSPLSKIFAPYAEMKCNFEIARAPYVAYVTKHELQKRYPTKGKSIGCSDVELDALNDSVLESRIKRVHYSENKIIFGTAAAINPIKGQEHIIRALAILKAKGITNIEYRLAGSGSAENLVRLAESLGVNEQLKVCGVLPHDEIFAWYDDLDVYIQPSLTEALCRSIIEAMSRALPVTCSHVGGNPELVTPDMIFHAGNVKQIAARMEMMLDPAIREREARKSFTKAHEFSKDILDRRRGEFYSEFTGVKNW